MSELVDIHALVQVIAADDADREDIVNLSQRLRSELLQLDIDSVAHLHSNGGPEGSKAAEALDFGAWLVTLSASGGVLSSLIELARDWVKRNAAARAIKITVDVDSLDLGKADSDERAHLIRAFIDAHDKRVTRDGK